MEEDRKTAEREQRRGDSMGLIKKGCRDGESAAVPDQDLIADLSAGHAIHVFLAACVRQRD